MIDLWFVLWPYPLHADQLGWIYWPLQCYCPEIPERGYCKPNCIFDAWELLISYNFIMNEGELLHCTVTLFVLVAAIFFWILSIFLPFTLFWKFEGLYSEPQIWIHYLLHSHCKSCCCHHWNNGMVWHLIKRISAIINILCFV